MVSVIVPVYNSEPYLKRCIESLLAQTLKDMEFILIDDCSVDRSCEICACYAEQDSRIRLIQNHENKGAAAARNIGMDVARGDYIGFVDSDDYIEPDMYEVLLEALTKDSADIVYCVISNKKNVKHKKIIFYKENAVIDFLCLNILGGYCWDKLYRRQIIETIQFPEDMNIGEDGVFCLRAILKAEKIVYINRQLYHYCPRENSLSEKYSFSPRHFEMFKQLEKVEEVLRDTNFAVKRYYIVFEFMLCFNLLNLLLKYSVEKEYADQFTKAEQVLDRSYKKTMFLSKNKKNCIKCVLYFLYRRHKQGYLFLAKKLGWL